ncbi:MAG: glycosyltransferase family 4 protein [Saprospiraceae bacterium]|nr:glycosyltransferase family 4 protein [Saprospiraceae bacterium]
MRKRYNIALLSYQERKYSETFIHNQLLRLKGNLHYLYGGAPPVYYGKGKRFLMPSIYNLLLRMLTGNTAQQQHLAAIEKYLRVNQIDLVLANYANTAFSLMEICRKNNMPLIVHFHGWTAYRKSFIRAHLEYYPQLFEIAQRIIAVSIDMKIQLEKLGAPSNKIEIIRCGADENLFEYGIRCGNSPDFFSPGRFCDTKNHELTIKAFYLVRQHIPNARLIFAGENEGTLERCVQLVYQLGLTSSVIFQGVLSHRQMREQMQKSIALVLHSTTTPDGEKEGTPVTLLEAALSGLPIISTKHGRIDEVFYTWRIGTIEQRG